MIVWIVGQKEEVFIPVGIYKSLEDAKWAVEAVFPEVEWKALDQNEWLGLRVLDEASDSENERYCISPMQVGHPIEQPERMS